MMFAHKRSEGSQGAIIADLLSHGLACLAWKQWGAGWSVVRDFAMSCCKAIKTRSHPLTLLKFSGFCLHDLSLKSIVCLVESPEATCWGDSQKVCVLGLERPSLCYRAVARGEMAAYTASRSPSLHLQKRRWQATHGALLFHGTSEPKHIILRQFPVEECYIFNRNGQDDPVGTRPLKPWREEGVRMCQGCLCLTQISTLYACIHKSARTCTCS